jgi:vacuolar protein sorting-associated protein 53
LRRRIEEPQQKSTMSPTASPRSRTTSRSISGGMPVTAKSIPPLTLPLAKDPAALLDTLDHNRRTVANRDGSKNLEPFDPIEFLNKHYETEQSLAAQLPALRDSVSSRMQVLNDRISNALQRQSETADSTRRHVQDAQASVMALERRILQVKEKAMESERAVLEITADMKRLDCAKRHLQRTITTLKRLHMLVHAVEQLRLTVHEQPYPDYKNASHLVDAITQLLQHFEAYTSKVQPMRVLSNKVTEYQESLRRSLVSGFRVVAFGRSKAMQIEGKASPGDDDEVERGREEPMSVSVLKGGVAFVNSLGEANRRRFIHEFCQDLMGDYMKEFEPPNHASSNNKPEKRVSSFKVVVDVKVEPENVHASLDQVEKRFSWFLNGPLNTINAKFPGVFPVEWQLQTSLASMFLQLVSSCTFSLALMLFTLLLFNLVRSCILFD